VGILAAAHHDDGARELAVDPTQFVQQLVDLAVGQLDIEKNAIRRLECQLPEYALAVGGVPRGILAFREGPHEPAAIGLRASGDEHAQRLRRKTRPPGQRGRQALCYEGTKSFGLLCVRHAHALPRKKNILAVLMKGENSGTEGAGTTVAVRWREFRRRMGAAGSANLLNEQAK
jgi:hypothetical protein